MAFGGCQLPTTKVSKDLTGPSPRTGKMAGVEQKQTFPKFSTMAWLSTHSLSTCEQLLQPPVPRRRGSRSPEVPVSGWGGPAHGEARHGEDVLAGRDHLAPVGWDCPAGDGGRVTARPSTRKSSLS